MSVRNISVALQAHLDQASTTTTRLLKITLRTGEVFGLAMLDQDVDYDDGDGLVTYSKTNGFDPSTIAADTGYSVDNAESYALAAVDSSGITPEMVRAGALDDGQWICYLINYEDKSMGHVILDAGDLGEVTSTLDMSWSSELLSYAMRLRQPAGSVYSRTCRAIFGSPADSPSGCGVDVTALWISGEVLSVGPEPNRSFNGDVIEGTVGPPFPGRLEWLTGMNVGRQYAVESIDSTDMVSLMEETPYPIVIGDTYRIRPDCRKRYTEDCIGIWDNGINFKGEPKIPVGDGVAVQAPGAGIPGGGGYSGPALGIDDA